jgi:hypothetical protein
MATIRDICTDTLLELGVVAPGESIEAYQANFVRDKLNRLLNQWNAKRCAVYATVYSSFTLTPSLSPHTIGPTAATWTVTQRPVSIEAISLVLNTSSPAAYIPLNKRDQDWWQAQSEPGITSDVPTDFFYNPTWVNGSVYFWPVPTVAYPVQLQIRTLLDDTVALNDEFSLPPGYQEAITLTLAEKCARAYGRSVTGELANDAGIARAIIFGNNDLTPRIATRDAGMQGPGGGHRPSFNYLIGSDS